MSTGFSAPEGEHQEELYSLSYDLKEKSPIHQNAFLYNCLSFVLTNIPSTDLKPLSYLWVFWQGRLLQANWPAIPMVSQRGGESSLVDCFQIQLPVSEMDSPFAYIFGLTIFLSFIFCAHYFLL